MSYWPCPARREELRQEYAGALVSLALYLAAQLVDATRDLSDVPAGQLHHRFLGWTRQCLPLTARAVFRTSGGRSARCCTAGSPGSRPSGTGRSPR
ncbi:hypothetical protein [Micromonospora sp. NPDC005220]|uniref:hypothetical protein n=1 Tax=Micromonospora sp. NPDC005220 TaxID=3155589 RepID=UPI0033BAECA4